MIKKLIFSLLIMILMCQIFAKNPDAVLGKWLTGDKQSCIEIYKEGDTFSGKIIWLNEPNYPEGNLDAGKPKMDKENPDESLRAKPILGLDIIWGFKYKEKKDAWIKGKIYDPNNGKTYFCRMELNEEGHLVVKGSLDKWGLAGRKVIWTRKS